MINQDYQEGLNIRPDEIVWIKNGKPHREDGPAIEYASGKKEWWVNGVEYTEEEFNQWLEKKLLNENLLATLEEKPSVKKVKI